MLDLLFFNFATLYMGSICYHCFVEFPADSHVEKIKDRASIMSNSIDRCRFFHPLLLIPTIALGVYIYFTQKQAVFLVGAILMLLILIISGIFLLGKYATLKSYKNNLEDDEFLQQNALAAIARIKWVHRIKILLTLAVIAITFKNVLNYGNSS